MAQRPSIKQPTPLNTRQTAGQSPLAPSPHPDRRNAPDPAATQLLGGLQSEISAEAAPLWNFVLDHARVLALAVVAVVALIAGVAGWQWYAETSLREARLELGRIVAKQDAAARLAELSAFVGNAAGALDGVSLAANLELAAAAVQTEAWETAEAAYQAIISQDKDSALALAARLNLADVQIRQGKAQEALTALDALLGTVEDDMKPMLHQQIAEAAEAAGQTQRAVTAYEAILAALSPAEADEAAFYQSRIDGLRQTP